MAPRLFGKGVNVKNQSQQTKNKTMSVVKYHRYPGNSLSRLFDEFFNNDLSRTLVGENVKSVPRINVLEKDNQFVIELAAPGLNKEDFQLHLEKDVLSIKADRQVENEENTDRYTRREFSYHRFERSFHLPKTINQEGIEAKYENGILNIHLPKKEEAVILKKEIAIV
jgi:HSP20 family protein